MHIVAPPIPVFLLNAFVLQIKFRVLRFQSQAGCGVRNRLGLHAVELLKVAADFVLV